MEYWILLVLANLWLCTSIVCNKIREGSGLPMFAFGLIYLFLAIYIGATDSGAIMEVRCLPEVVVEEAVEN